MNLEEIKTKLEDSNLDQSEVEDIVVALNKKSEQEEENKVDDEIIELQGLIKEETDWRKKAKISAQIISLRLST